MKEDVLGAQFPHGLKPTNAIVSADGYVGGVDGYENIQNAFDSVPTALRVVGRLCAVKDSNGRKLNYFQWAKNELGEWILEPLASGGGTTGDYIPLTGTEVGKPFNGTIEMSEEGAFSVSKSTQNVESVFTLNDDGLYFANLDTLYNLCFLSVRRDTSMIGIGGDGKDKRIEITKDSISAQSENNAYIATEDADILTKKFFDDNTRVVVTKPQLDSLITTSSLIPNTLYEISGCDADLYGGTTLYLRAVTNNELEINGIGKFYNPKYNQEVDGYGIFDFDADYSVNDTTIWGGRKWICIDDTVNEEPINQFTLDDTKWNVVAYNDTDYNVAYDEIKYDYANDWIAERHEVKGGNIVSCGKATYDYDMTNMVAIGYNAIKSFQWGNVFTEDFGKGLNGNTVNESWFDCVNSKCDNIYNNTFNTGSYIYNNTFNAGSYIYNNTLNAGSYIYYNTFNTGSSIYNNTFNAGSSINNNTFNTGSYIYDNTFNAGSSINNNTLNAGSSINNNTLNNGSSIYNNTFNAGRIDFGTLTTNIARCIVSSNPSSSVTLGATARTVLSSNYSKEVKTNANSQVVIQYINESNQLTIVPITSQ